MFSKTCPLFIESRWNFVHDTLKWLIHRRECFAFLSLGLEDIRSCKELSTHEIDMIVQLSDNSAWSHKFWLTAELCKLLADWGTSVSVRLHQCPCHSFDESQDPDPEAQQNQKLCRFKGRQSSAMAWGMWKGFLKDLEGVQFGGEALRFAHLLSRMEAGPETVSELQKDFQACKSDMLLRAKQAWSFWDELPWSVLKIPGFLWGVTTEHDCRRAARVLVQDYSASASTSSMGVVAMRFLSDLGEFRGDIDAWINGNALAPRTKTQLLLYSSCLIVMQRLEAKHHYLHVQVSRGRASSPPATIAELRRKANPEVHSEAFRHALSRLMKSFDSLVAVPWQSFGDLLRAVYGHGLEYMHPDVASEVGMMQQHLLALSECKLANESSLLPIHRDHIQKCLKKDQVYALPATDVRSDTQECDFHAFRVVSLNPGMRMYIQRASAMSSDATWPLLLLAGSVVLWTVELNLRPKSSNNPSPTHAEWLELLGH